MPPEIKAVGFDFYGVLSLYPPGDVFSLIAELFHISTEDFRKKYFTLNYLSSLGNYSFEDVAIQTALSLTTNHHKEKEARELIRKRQTERRLNVELISWFPALKKQGLKIGILSNATTAVRKDWEQQKFFDLIDATIVSAEVGYQKPQAEAFEFLFQKLEVLPQETIFIDDSQKSLGKANEIGYHPILFKNNEQLRLDLHKFGIVL